MKEAADMGVDNVLKKEASQLEALLKEMKEGLDTVRSKVQALTAKVKGNQLPTSDGISYLEAKHLLLLNYCLSLVYYLLRKAKGYSIEGHPVTHSLVEIRLFLEKIRPVDKRMEYQIQKLTRATMVTRDNAVMNEKETDTHKGTDDLLKYRPNPEMLISKSDMTSKDDGVYRPPKFAPTSMEEDKISKKDKQALRKDRETLLQSRQSNYMRELMDDMAGKPEEVKETVGLESREVSRYAEKMEERARREEELFTRAPMTKMERKREKFLKKSRYGLNGLTDDFYDEIKSLPIRDSEEFPTGGRKVSRGMGKLKKRKRRH